VFFLFFIFLHYKINTGDLWVFFFLFKDRKNDDMNRAEHWDNLLSSSEVEDGLGSSFSVDVVGDELNLAASSCWNLGGSEGVLSGSDEMFGALSGVGWASDEELDVFVLVLSIGPSANNAGGLFSARDVSDSVELVGRGGH